MDRTLGIDVSKWNDDNSTAQQVDFSKAKAAGAEFVFIKSSQANWADEDILYNWKSAKSAGLLRGAYHFMVWNIKPETQAEYMWSVLKADPGELPPTVDFEWWGGYTPTNGLEMLWAFVVRLEALCGRKPMIYTAPGWWLKYKPADGWKNYPLWQAQYNYKPDPLKPWGSAWTFWQYSSNGDGKLFGCESKDVDMNWFNGSKEALYQFAGMNVIPEKTYLDYTPDERLTRLCKAAPAEVWK